MHDPKTIDFNLSPFVAIWETTRACDLACVHCRAAAQSRRSQFELTTEEGFRLIDQIAEMRPKVFVITGGDPLKRDDLYDHIRYAKELGLEPSVTPSATPLLTPEAIAKMKEAGVKRLAISLDHYYREAHDEFRRVPGSFDLTIRAIEAARDNDIPIQINSTVSKKTAADMPKMAALLSKYPNVVMWSVFFLVPTGRARNADMIEPEEVETLFGLLHDISKTVPFDVRTTEAMHYRRFVLQRIMAAQGKSTDEMIDPATGLIDASTIFMSAHAHGHPGQPGSSTARPLDSSTARPLDSSTARQLDSSTARQLDSSLKMPLGVQMQSGAITRAPKGVNEAKGFVFVSHIGDVFPSGFLPLKAGNVKHESLVDIYRNSDLFRRLRDVGNLKGKCAVCEFRELCGGSRSRAWAALGDPFASDPTCTYMPVGAVVA